MTSIVRASVAGLLAVAIPGAGPVRPVAASASREAAPLDSLFRARQWLNTSPLMPRDLQGKVVVVNFWTYSCVYCLRSLPYLSAWSEKYKDRGLVVVGVHSPEFTFEKDVANVNKALTLYGIRYPVVMDTDFSIWRAFNNEAWPAFYFLGADGRIRHQVLGEGNYDQSERVIQQLLADAGGSAAGMGTVTVRGEGAQAASDQKDVRSPETYVGYAKATNFSSPDAVKRDAASTYRAPSMLALNHWSVGGQWTIGGEFASLQSAPGSIVYRFHARDLHLVLAPPPGGRPVRFRVRIDGAAPGASHGFDVDAEGYGTVREDRLYQLVRQAGSVTDHTFEIEFLDPGVRAYAFTFG